MLIAAGIIGLFALLCAGFATRLFLGLGNDRRRASQFDGLDTSTIEELGIRKGALTAIHGKVLPVGTITEPLTGSDVIWHRTTAYKLGRKHKGRRQSTKQLFTVIGGRFVYVADDTGTALCDVGKADRSQLSGGRRRKSFRSDELPDAMVRLFEENNERVSGLIFQKHFRIVQRYIEAGSELCVVGKAVLVEDDNVVGRAEGYRTTSNVIGSFEGGGKLPVESGREKTLKICDSDLDGYRTRLKQEVATRRFTAIINAIVATVLFLVAAACAVAGLEEYF